VLVIDVEWIYCYWNFFGYYLFYVFLMIYMGGVVREYMIVVFVVGVC